MAESERIRVSSAVAFLVMKAMALHDRMKEKDAWDICFTVTHYPGGLDALIEEFRPHLLNRLVQEGLQKIAGKFASPQHTGPKFVADFEDVQDPDAPCGHERLTNESIICCEPSVCGKPNCDHTARFFAFFFPLNNFQPPNPSIAPTSVLQPSRAKESSK